MRALLHLGRPARWSGALGVGPWSLAPVSGKPLLEYWLEWASEKRIREITLVLGDGAYEIESFCEDGERWGLHITFGFQKETEAPARYMRRSPDQWRDGVLYVEGPVFPGHPDAPIPPCFASKGTWTLEGADGPRCVFSTESNRISRWMESGEIPPSGASWEAIGMTPRLIEDIRAYYDLNMRMVAGERDRYVRSGYVAREGVAIGYNVQIPPSVELRPPLSIGNDCRFHPMSVIGPNTVIGNRVIVDRQTEIADAVVLDGTYLGRNLEIKEKIVVGNRILAPADGIQVDVEEPWLAASLERRVRTTDVARAVVGWCVALCLAPAQAIPFALLYPAGRRAGAVACARSRRLCARNIERLLPLCAITKSDSVWARIFFGLSLDCFPSLINVLIGRLWLCGHAPLHPERDETLRRRLQRYYPAAIGFHSRRPEQTDPVILMAESLYYERYAGVWGDLRLLFQTLLGRLLDALAGATR